MTEEFQLVSRMNPLVTQGVRRHEDRFEFNKDAGMSVCKAGHMAVRKAVQGKKGVGTNQTMTYYFDVARCDPVPYPGDAIKPEPRQKRIRCPSNPNPMPKK